MERVIGRVIICATALLCACEAPRAPASPAREVDAAPTVLFEPVSTVEAGSATAPDASDDATYTVRLADLCARVRDLCQSVRPLSRLADAGDRAATVARCEKDYEECMMGVRTK